MSPLQIEGYRKKVASQSGSGRNFFSPSIYEYAASLIEERPVTVSKDAELLYRAQLKAWQNYHHPMMTVGIDVYNVEPEAFGAVLDAPPDHGVPSVISHPFSTVSELRGVQAPDPIASGRMPMILGVAGRLAKECAETTVYVPICGPLALANNLVGMDEVLCTMMEEPDSVKEALVHLANVQLAYVQAIIDSGAWPFIFESGASPPLLPPTLFSGVEAPALGQLFENCRAAGDPSPACILGGNVLPVLKDLLALKPGFLICPSETNQEEFVKIASHYPQTSIRVNMSVSCLLEKNWAKTEAEAVRAINLARQIPLGSVGTGVIPFDIPAELILRLRDFVQQYSLVP